MKVLLSGNEAIALGAYENGVAFAAGYPGTPGTEILETIAEFKEVNAQWSPNEKVALDTAIGASLAGVRSLVAMKHVGLNVAADTLMTLSYTGIHAGLVIVSVDDPGAGSSQNEQDNRNFAKFAKIPLLEPSDSQEAKDFVRYALEISERFDTPVLLRMTARVAHSKCVVNTILKRQRFFRKKPFASNPAKYVMIPYYSQRRHTYVEERLRRLKRFSEEFRCNIVERKRKNFGIITSSISYQYAKEIFPEASFLKLGMTYPLPEKLIRRFAKKFSLLYVIEELDPFLEEQIAAMGIKVRGKDLFPLTGEFNPDMIRDALFGQKTKKDVSYSMSVPDRLPSLCAGCSYLGLFYVLKKLKIIVIGDIGCYSLCALAPFSSLETCISMGSGVGIAHGLKKNLKNTLRNKIIAVIGDSTFFHSGITPLIDIVYNKSATHIIILDNQATAMTGGQGHPGTGRTLKKEKVPRIDYCRLVKSLGIKKVSTINLYNLREVKKTVKKHVDLNHPSVIIAKGRCILLKKRKQNTELPDILIDRCVNCQECIRLGCPAVIADGRNKPYIDKYICTGCTLCRQVCLVRAIKVNGNAESKR